MVGLSQYFSKGSQKTEQNPTKQLDGFSFNFIIEGTDTSTNEVTTKKKKKKKKKKSKTVKNEDDNCDGFSQTFSDIKLEDSCMDFEKSQELCTTEENYSPLTSKCSNISSAISTSIVKNTTTTTLPIEVKNSQPNLKENSTSSKHTTTTITTKQVKNSQPNIKEKSKSNNHTTKTTTTITTKEVKNASESMNLAKIRAIEGMARRKKKTSEVVKADSIETYGSTTFLRVKKASESETETQKMERKYGKGRRNLEVGKRKPVPQESFSFNFI